MFDRLAELLAQFNGYTKSNPVLAGIVSLYGLGVLTFMLKNVPTRVWNFICDQTTTRLVVDNTYDGRSEELFLNFMSWYSKSRWSRWSRVMRVYSGWNYDENNHYKNTFSIGIDGAAQLVFWEGMPCIFRRSTISSGQSASSKIIYEVSLRRLGRNRDSLQRLFDQIKPNAVTSQLFNHHYAGDGWQRGGIIAPRDIDSVFVEDSIKRSILESIDWFTKNESWYARHGIPYKLCIMLTGEPGGGKTSLVRAIATKLHRDVYNIALPQMSDKELRSAFQKADADGIILLEDFNHSALVARNQNLAMKAADKAKHGYETEKSNVLTKDNMNPLMGLDLSPLTLHGFLQVFDGMDSVHGKIIFLTTNVHMELDKAVVRKGRVDHTFSIDKLQDREIKQYIKRAFPDRITATPESNDVVYAPITGADLQALFIDNPDDYEQFVRSIPLLSSEEIHV